MRKIIISIHLFFIFNYALIAHDYSKEGIKIDHPVIKIVKPESKVGAGYMEIINKSNRKIKLIGLESNIAKTQEIHEVILENDVYKMRPLNKGVFIAPKDKLEFKPRSFHFMFFNFNKKIEHNEMLKAELVFDKGLIIPIKFKVIIGHHEHSH